MNSPYLPNIFEYKTDNEEQIRVRTYNINGEVWVSIDDLCKSLSINDVNAIMNILDEDEFLYYEEDNINIVNESGLYNVIFQSNNSDAKKFKRWITTEVLPSIRKKGFYGNKNNEFITHDFARRYNLNWNRVDEGYFSVLNEIYYLLYGKFEMLGFTIPDKYYISSNNKERYLRAYISIGKGFSTFLKKNYLDLYKQYQPKKYRHKLREGYEVDCFEYDRKIHHLFVEYIEKVWIRTKAQKYFEERLPQNECDIILELIEKLYKLENKNSKELVK